MLKSRWGQFTLSLILGFGLVTLFRQDCKNANCFSFVAPDPNEIKKNIYKFGDVCYKFDEAPQQCTTKDPIHPPSTGA